jgi:hypothetical protein
MSALLKAISPSDLGADRWLGVADTGAKDHMVPDRSAFISYKAVHHLCIWMGNNSYAPVLGWGTAIISLNGQRLLIRNALYVPTLRVPLYSLRAHLRQCGCGFVGSYDTGMRVYFLGVVLSMDMLTDCLYPMSLLVSCLPIHPPLRPTTLPSYHLPEQGLCLSG